jgi:hypothetical protein
MAVGAAAATINAWLASILNGTAPTTYTGPFVQLHTGAPGAAGTTNIAGNTTRVAATGTWVPSGGSCTNPAAVNWTNVGTAETYADVSLWSLATGGTFIASGTITANAVAIGDNFSIPIGGMTISVPVAS